MYSKKPRQFLLIRQAYLGALIGYRVVQWGNVLHQRIKFHFPITKATIGVSRSYGMPDGS